MGGIYTRQSGGPFTFRIGADRARTGNTQITGSNGAQRPEYVNAPGCNPNATTGDTSNYIKTECFAFPQLGVLGNLGRNTLTMPTFRDLDFTVFKNQNLWGEKVKAQFRVEMFNVLNNTNFTAQMQTLFDGSGNLVSSVRKPINPTANASRQIQLGLRLVF